MKKSILILMSFLLTFNTWAESRAGSGGDGILHDGKIYLLDLLESGVEENPYFDEPDKQLIK